MGRRNPNTGEPPKRRERTKTVDPYRVEPFSKIEVDWDELRIQFVTGGNISLSELARRHKIPRMRLAARAHRERWQLQKEQYSNRLQDEVLEASVQDKATKLLQWNEATLIEANYLREAARRLYMRRMADGSWVFNRDVPAKNISAAAAANVAADKLARLAMGASTENNMTVTRELPSSVDDFL